MIDYFAEARLTVTAPITGNLSRILGVALSLFHKSHSEKIRRYEDSQEPDRLYAVALLQAELTEFEAWHRSVSGMVDYQRASEESAQAELTDVNRKEAA